MDFFVAILVAFLADGTPAFFETLPVRSYEECSTMVKAAAEDLRLQLPAGSEVRYECISTQSMGPRTAS